jgi:hypothetical protein
MGRSAQQLGWETPERLVRTLNLVGVEHAAPVTSMRTSAFARMSSSTISVPVAVAKLLEPEPDEPALAQLQHHPRSDCGGTLDFG